MNGFDKVIDVVRACIRTIYNAPETIKNGTYLGPRGLFHIGGYPKTIKPSRYFQKNNAQLILETEDIISKLK